MNSTPHTQQHSLKSENTIRKKNKIEEENDKNGAKQLMLEQLMLLSVGPTCCNKDENQNPKNFGF